MKKIVTATILTLGLAFAVAPAQADDTDSACPTSVGYWNERATSAEVQLAAAQQKIAEQKARIKRLRHRLHHH